jgi:octaprenyl-diphosphate synthase
MSEGELLQIEKARRLDIKEEIYFEIIRKKTASLIASACAAGAASGGATADEIERMRLLGEKIGIAFQIQDDILDSFGQTAEVGKRIGGDIASNKKTLLLIELLASAHKDDIKLIQQLLAEPNDEIKIAGVLALYQKYQIKAFAESQKQQYLDRAFHHLQAVSVQADRKQIVMQTAQELMQRMS